MAVLVLGRQRQGVVDAIRVAVYSYVHPRCESRRAVSVCRVAVGTAVVVLAQVQWVCWAVLLLAVCRCWAVRVVGAVLPRVLVLVVAAGCGAGHGDVRGADVDAGDRIQEAAGGPSRDPWTRENI